MKFLRKQLDMVEPLFKKGGKLEKLYPLYEANDTFLFTPGEVTKGTSHVRDAIDMKRMMSTVIVALVPCILMALWNTGYQANLAIAEQGAKPLQTSITGLDSITRDYLFTQVLGMEYDPHNPIANLVHGALWFLPVYIACMAVGGLCEVTFAIIRGHEINEGFLVSGMLFPLTLPPAIPLWQVGLGIAFGIVVGKEIFGGTGKNFLNPALTARAFLYFAHASFMSGDRVWTAAAAENGVDGWTAATTLGSMATADVAQAADVNAVSGLSWFDCFMGWIPGSMGETSTLACLIGAAILIASGIGSWRIMTGVLLGAIGMSCMLYAFREYSDNSMVYLSPLRHLVVGGFAFGTVFMATDPVSASMTESGKWWYGGLIGVMTVLIRVINPAFAEGIMLAILFGNVMAPLIDYCVIQSNVKRRAARYATT
ncbi:NADH:ubiquinone reductase (Na(+)-transporting) subunit B [Botrimarina hoheduenensis]|uniref:Na(+)-translocating NADH-quinone reductase subunit B n=1 Tax=Botrimarina hoheduenensis TaxID=2528000 RepID=A0A5C5VRG5_9BACT|nr:NADH:ubiquinone reductase (Na(+)-transporting) subunit B [Botrimarina hoheduenensis]TWT40162.1 Na(+)-translocating NADH-quinone reductase subunit B [Botrimarina hoheduenensis]